MVSGERVLVVDWQLGGTVLRSGFALADDATARRWADWLQAMAGGGHDRANPKEARR
jgi:hypothetical protein